MALASIMYVDGTIRPIAVDKAIAAHEALTGMTEPTEAQAEWLCSIRRIFIPPSHRPANYTPVYYSKPGPKLTEHKLTNPGVLQGMSEIIPRGDR